jgi:hypothetical protein
LFHVIGKTLSAKVKEVSGLALRIPGGQKSKFRA